jgi:hypothetical protein
VFLLGVAGFTPTSLLCEVAWNADVLIALGRLSVVAVGDGRRLTGTE